MPKKVPYLQEEQIERDASALLTEYEHERGVRIVRAVPIEGIIEKHLRLSIEFGDMHVLIGVPHWGLGLEPDILGAMISMSGASSSTRVSTRGEPREGRPLPFHAGSRRRRPLAASSAPLCRKPGAGFLV